MPGVKPCALTVLIRRYKPHAKKEEADRSALWARFREIATGVGGSGKALELLKQYLRDISDLLSAQMRTHGQ
jgi:hypothetical protein